MHHDQHAAAAVPRHIAGGSTHSFNLVDELSRTQQVCRRWCQLRLTQAFVTRVTRLMKITARARGHTIFDLHRFQDRPHRQWLKIAQHRSSIWGPARDDRCPNFVTAISCPKSTIMLAIRRWNNLDHLYIRLAVVMQYRSTTDGRNCYSVCQYRPLHLCLMQNLASKILCIFVTGGAYAPHAPCLSTPLGVVEQHTISMCSKCFPLALTNALRQTRHWSVALSATLLDAKPHFNQKPFQFISVQFLTDFQ